MVHRVQRFEVLLDWFDRHLQRQPERLSASCRAGVGAPGALGRVEERVRCLGDVRPSARRQAASWSSAARSTESSSAARRSTAGPSRSSPVRVASGCEHELRTPGRGGAQLVGLDVDVAARDEGERDHRVADLRRRERRLQLVEPAAGHGPSQEISRMSGANWR